MESCCFSPFYVPSLRAVVGRAAIQARVPLGPDSGLLRFARNDVVLMSPNSNGFGLRKGITGLYLFEEKLLHAGENGLWQKLGIDADAHSGHIFF
jgi:hypothetical protein